MERAEHLDPWMSEIMSELEELMHERGQKYGPGNISEWGDLGVVVRLSDKMARLRNLYQTGRGADVSDESVEDTLMDIANYAIIALGWRRGHWPGSEENKVSEPSSSDLELCEHCGIERYKHKETDHWFISEEQ